jgi:methylmalonyl-CoA carboxyltransferase large subunit
MDLTRVVDALEGLRQELCRLGQRVSALEAAAGSPLAVAGSTAEQAADGLSKAATQPSQRPADPALSKDVILIISAAIAAFLGKKPHIRQIRLVGSGVWAQQGRVTIQASHSLTVHSARSLP